LNSMNEKDRDDIKAVKMRAEGKKARNSAAAL
jgi:hypothetical protein